jgi:hypothetical protein
MSFLALISDAEISEAPLDLFILILPNVALGVEG